MRGKKVRKLHHRVALVAFIFLGTSVVTGLFWAYAPYLYWKDGYMKRKHEVAAPELVNARLSIFDAIENARKRFGKKVVPLAVTLKVDAGSLLYDIRYETETGKKQAALLDAISGIWRSPLTKTDAVSFARQYVADRPQIKEVVYFEAWVRRNAKIGKPAWRVRFTDASDTEIFLNPNTGEILEDQDNTRRFHFWVMRLHQFNFFGTRKVLTIFSGLPLLILMVTGLRMALSRIFRRQGGDYSGRAQSLGPNINSVR